MLELLVAAPSSAPSRTDAGAAAAGAATADPAGGLFSFDEATGLPDRAAFLQQVDSASRQARRDGHGFALLAINVPQLRELRSSQIFGTPDTLSLAVALALAARLHAGRDAGQIVTHLTGTGFAALLPTGTGQGTDAVRERALVLRAALQAPVSLAGTEVLPAVEVGIALFPDDGADAATLLAAAQAALADAAATGGVSFSRRECNAPALRELRRFAALRAAIEGNTLGLHYQPKLSLESGEIVGTQALPLWRSAEWGDCVGAALAALVERSGQAAVFGDWLLAQVCRQAVAWRCDGLMPGPVSVSLTPGQFRSGDVSRQVQAALLATGAAPGDIGIELSEGALLHDIERATRVLHELTAIGVAITLCDFGTGYSRLTSLAQLPIDIIKIDRSLVHDVTASAESVSVTRAIIHMAHGLHRPVIADGVMTEGQAGMLGAKGCDQVQGDCFSPPVAAEALATMLREGRRLPEHLRHHHEHRRTLLVVDDEEGMRAALKRLLRRDGYQVLTACSGAEGLACLAEHAVDVILSDQRMPGMSGVEFLRLAKALYPDTVRMTLSGFTELQSIIDAVNEGAIYKFLTKPWDDELLRQHISKAFAHKEMADENRRLTAQLASANVEMEALNGRLAALLQAQQAQTQLLATSASGARELLERLPAAVFGIDPDGLLAYANRAALHWLPAAVQGVGAVVAEHLPQLHALAALPPDCATRVDLQGRAVWATSLALDEATSADKRRGRLVMLVPVHTEPRS